MIYPFCEEFIFTKLRICEVLRKLNLRENVRIYSIPNLHIPLKLKSYNSASSNSQVYISPYKPSILFIGHRQTVQIHPYKPSVLFVGHRQTVQTHPCKPSVLFVGHRQTVQTQIRRCRMQRLIRVSTVCLQNVLSEFG